MYPKCDWWIHWEKNDPEPTIYPRCSHWFPGHLAPSVTSCVTVLVLLRWSLATGLPRLHSNWNTLTRKDLVRQTDQIIRDKVLPSTSNLVKFRSRSGVFCGSLRTRPNRQVLPTGLALVPTIRLMSSSLLALLPIRLHRTR